MVLRDSGPAWRLHREEVVLSEDALRDEDRVQRLRETTVDRGVGEGFDDLDRAEPDVGAVLTCTPSCGSQPPRAVSIPRVKSCRCGGVRPGRM